MQTNPNTQKMNVLANNGRKKSTVDLNPDVGAGLFLKILQNPEPVFYKDEGGKANHLLVTLCLQSMPVDCKLTESIIGSNLHVDSKLCYENGKEVEDGAEIFRMLSMAPKYISSINDKVTCKFRIEKVSRRKDGRRFKVQFDINKTLSPNFEVAGVCTSPVCVLSKRKSSNLSLDDRKIGRSPPLSKGYRITGSVLNSNGKRRYPLPTYNVGNRARGVSVPMTKSELAALDEVDSMRRSVCDMGTKIDKLVERVAFLEDQNSILRESLNVKFERSNGTDSGDDRSEFNFEPVQCNPETVCVGPGGITSSSKREMLIPAEASGCKLNLDFGDVEILRRI